MNEHGTTAREKRGALHFINAPYQSGFNKCAWCVPQKSISGAVGATLGNAPCTTATEY